MVDKELIEKIRRLKEDRGYTLYDLAKRVDIQPSTLERWFKTNRINRIYAETVRVRLGIK
ncbi:MAG: helix-turn-helix domain-containing protein [Candidatus Omnitrophica bacterium]|nr:helix-turn-helix domain-containing protein [Candidatus Omnitrophota bacterium]MDD5310888.1 helix-turn-helix domain-containing protein [Candidatus Omnitrophota bacterium]MDD5546383.1 helix-turn-helix domain-containing protein [Candidatus Omnitrophota bacterium]